MTTKEFMEKIVQDEELRKAMSVYTTTEEAYEAAKAHGLTDDKETFMAVAAAIQRHLSGELSDEELEEISGGANDAVAWGVGCGAIGVIITGTLSALSI